MIVLPIKSEETVPWIMEKHYAKRLPSISYAFGLYENKILIGIITYGMPASPNVCKGICGEKYKNIVLELNRLCLLNNKKNESSFLIANSIKLLPKPKIIVSYADTAKNHFGYVYQATNFLFTGTSKERTHLSGINGKHPRHYKEKTIDRVLTSGKHRYIFFHGTKNDKKCLKSNLKYDVEPYPKGENKRYDSGDKVITQQLLF